jgi:hypothetical protein
MKWTMRYGNSPAACGKGAADRLDHAELCSEPIIQAEGGIPRIKSAADKAHSASRLLL